LKTAAKCGDGGTLLDLDDRARQAEEDEGEDPGTNPSTSPIATIATKPTSTRTRRPYLMRPAISRIPGGPAPCGWVREIAIAPLKKISPSRPVIVTAPTASISAATLIPLVRSRDSTSTWKLRASRRPRGTKTRAAKISKEGIQPQ
jgi:hypothetical protein